MVDSKKEQPDKEAEEMKFVTEGFYYKKDGNYFISYAESPVTGLDGTNTIMKIESDSVMLIRSGTASSLMFLKRLQAYFRMQYRKWYRGAWSYRTKLECQFDDKGGQFQVEYVLEVNNRLTSLTTLNVKVF